MNLSSRNVGYFAFRALCVGVFLFVGIFGLTHTVLAATLKVVPQNEAYTVGDTFDVSILLDTEGESVNAIDVDLRFPPDKLQLVSPKTSLSVISIWTSQPKFSNETGRVRLQGGIPRGVNVNNALVGTLTFRVKAVGSAIVRFGNESKVLLNDGLGTDALSHRVDAIYKLTLPPPAGPIVTSTTHPDQAKWYQSSNVTLLWQPVEEGAQGYSYVLNDQPVGDIDDTSEGINTTVTYKNLSDGQYYFHIKALRGGVWGGSTHYSFKIDGTAPAEFPVEISPAPRTVATDPIIKFLSSDALSGIDRYELKLVPLKPSMADDDRGTEQLFIETESPYISPELEPGPYDVIVRAYDGAGNFTESVERLTITTEAFNFISADGISLFGYVFPWLWIIIALCAILVGLIILVVAIRHWHRKMDTHSRSRIDGNLPDMIRQQLDELKRYKHKYSGVLTVAILVGLTLFSGAQVRAQQAELAPPYVTTISRNISNNEIFYIGGSTEDAGTEIILYTQNLNTGETQSYTVRSDRRGEWFYRHNNFLSTGTYLLWTQAKVGEQLSPPSPQIEVTVSRSALQIGSSRVTLEGLYAITSGVLLLIIIIFIIYIRREYLRAKMRHQEFAKEFREAEDSIRRGFAVLRKDVQRQIQAIQKIKLSREMIREEKEREEQLLRDLENIERRIGKEIWDVGRLEGMK